MESDDDLKSVSDSKITLFSEENISDGEQEKEDGNDSGTNNKRSKLVTIGLSLVTVVLFYFLLGSIISLYQGK